MKEEVQLRRATLRDLPTLVLHRRAMWEALVEVPEAALNRGDRVYRRWLRARMQRGDAVAFVAETRGRVPVASGAVFVRDIDPSPSGVATSPHTISMFTEKGCRGQGIARDILHELRDWCEARGFAAVTLSPAPKARRLYRRVGFERAWGMVLRFPPRHPGPHARRRPPRGPREG
ncbi:MAG: GNAT family N-acetyltransferase [Euryarchaeota archaeon]|nr:GNAT family N-acetyltransferase [Euryarchaeota archaeon]MDE2045831.1 GNAT family N-acetyltransferase [Thermoplasmata archaeon]